MAFETLFLDGFDHLLTADLAAKYDAVSSSLFTVDATVARTGGKALKMESTTGDAYMLKNLGMGARTLVVGLAVYPTGVGSNTAALTSTGKGLLVFASSGDIEGRLIYNDLGKLAYQRRNSNGFTTIVLASASSLPLNQWSYVEFRIYFDNTAGEAEIRINGATDASATGLDTQNAASSVNTAYLCACPSTVYIDDLYIRGATDLQAGGFLGDSKVLTVLPNAAGSSAQLTPTGAASNHEAVDETTPDGDTSYVGGNTGKDLYNFADITAATIHAAQLSVLAKKSDAGARSVAPRVKSGATEDAGSNQALSTDYRYKTKVWETNPNTATAWDQASINAAEFGLSIEG